MENKDFSQIYQKNYRRSFLFAKSYVHNDLAAEDIAVESILKYWQALTSDNNAVITEALLLTIIKNKALDYLRHEAVHQTTVADLTDMNQRELNLRISTLEACDPEEIFSSEIQSIVTKTLSQLPQQTREIFEMSRFDHKSVKEISIITGLSAKSIEYHITKSLKALRISLKDYLPFFCFFCC